MLTLLSSIIWCHYLQWIMICHKVFTFCEELYNIYLGTCFSSMVWKSAPLMVAFATRRAPLNLSWLKWVCVGSYILWDILHKSHTVLQKLATASDINTQKRNTHYMKVSLTPKLFDRRPSFSWILWSNSVCNKCYVVLTAHKGMIIVLCVWWTPM